MAERAHIMRDESFGEGVKLRKEGEMWREGERESEGRSLNKWGELPITKTGTPPLRLPRTK